MARYGEPKHITEGIDCWCRPQIIETDGAKVIVHHSWYSFSDLAMNLSAAGLTFRLGKRAISDRRDKDHHA